MHLKASIGKLFSPAGTFLFISFNLVLFLLFYAFDVQAQTTMSNSSYIIKFPNLNSFAGKPSNSQYKLGITGGQTAPGLYSGSNYKVRAGFQYILSNIPFSFAISSLFIDFGPITPGAPVTRTNNLTVSNGSAYGYTVLARENHPLRVNSSGMSIPDTTCDTGTCNEQTSAAWSSLTTFGFGYRCDNVTGNDCQSGFSNATNYRQFASSESAELAFPVMRGVNRGRNIQSQVTYKVNVATTQAAGLYENIITFIAVPSI
ncbi:MAG: hypothetical protein EPO24_09905 [Bacteroidetes bacterium]|nr:MAG: hypothetical protein EPO24_09905 [Bacteroidota bacterium]